MARVVVSYVFADGDQVQVAASGKTTYPDALAQLRAEAIKGLTECVQSLRTAVEVDEQ